MMKEREPFPEETIAGFSELLEVFKKIHARLVSEGWIIFDSELKESLKHHETDTSNGT